ncbi:MAG: CheR family methyltransferase [Bdellovibrio sp.]
MQELLNIRIAEQCFFQTQTVWEYFSHDFLPMWQKKNPEKVLRIWSLGTGSGEEAYSIVMMCEEFRILYPEFAYQITATDYSTELLNVARKGLYNGKTVEHLEKNYPSLFQKYFMLNEKKYAVKPYLKAKVRFELHNPLNQFGNENDFDIVFMRSVLPYFDDSEKEKILENISTTLVKNGFLIIGESESLAALKSPFKLRRPLVYENTVLIYQ